MRRAAGEDIESLELMLDALCNSLGGIIFILLLIGILAGETAKAATEKIDKAKVSVEQAKERIGRMKQASVTASEYEKELSGVLRANQSTEESIKLAGANMQPGVMAETRKTERDLLEIEEALRKARRERDQYEKEREEKKRELEALKGALAQKKGEMEKIRGPEDKPEEKLKLLLGENERLKKELDRVAQILVRSGDNARVVRDPETATAKAPMAVIIRGKRFYPLYRWWVDMKHYNRVDLNFIPKGKVLECRTKVGKGLPILAGELINDNLLKRLDQMDRKRFYLDMIVFEGSYKEAIRLREYAATSDLESNWKPWKKREPLYVGIPKGGTTQ